MNYIVALGNGLEKKNGILDLTIESKMTALAAYLCSKEKLGDKIIFAGGYTKGKKASEAQKMLEFVKENFANVLEENILLEEKSIDTAGNAYEVGRLLSNDQKIILVSFGYHLLRAKQLFCNFGINVDSAIASESILAKSSPKYENLLRNYSLRRKIVKFLREVAFLSLVYTIDPRGKILRVITSRTRA